MARRKTTRPGMIRSSTREASELAEMLTRLLVPVVGQDQARSLAFQTIVSKSATRRASGARKVQKLLGLKDASRLATVLAKVNFKNAR